MKLQLPGCPVRGEHLQMALIACLVLFVVAVILICVLFKGAVFIFVFIQSYLTSFYTVSFILFQLLIVLLPRDTRYFYFITCAITSFMAFIFDIRPVFTILIYVLWAGIAYMGSDIHQKATNSTQTSRKAFFRPQHTQKKALVSLRLQCWKKLFTFSYIPPLEEKFVLAGRRGETFLKDYISSHQKFRNSHVFPSRRLANIGEKGRKEIDMIVVTDHKIYVLECKNWSGDLLINGDNWIHKNTIEGKRTVTNEYDACSNPINLNRSKAELLYDTLLFNGFPITMDDIVSKVILMNKNLNVHGQSENLSDLILFKDLDPYLSEQDTQVRTSLAERIVLSILSLCLDEKHFPIVADTISPALGGEKREAMIRFLQELPSWDHVYLTPNAVAPRMAAKNMPFKVFQGDLLYWSDIPALPESIHYQNIKSVRVLKHRKKLLSLFLTLLGRYPLVLHITMKDGSTRKVRANPDGTILFHEAGQKEPVQIPILSIDQVEIRSK